MTLRDKIAEIVDRHYHNELSPKAEADLILALPEISDLQKKLAEVEAERDQARLAKDALPLAYQMGLDAAARESQGIANTVRLARDAEYAHMVAISCRDAIRALQPPADLVERAKEPKP